MATGDDVKLIGSWSSPYGMRTRIALNIKSVSYDFIEETFGTKSELLLKSNPVYKKIPVLIHRGKPICESLIIVEYIDQVWNSSGPSILPSDPYDRAIAKFWAAYIDDKVFPSVKGLMAQDEEARKSAIAQLEESFSHLENAFAELSKGKSFFNGDTIGYIDIALGGSVGWLRALEKLHGLNLLDESKFPSLAKWVQSFCSDPSVKPVMQDTEKLVELAKIVQTMLAAPAPASAPAPAGSK